jgi:AcrR family transcriptional regulator
VAETGEGSSGLGRPRPTRGAAPPIAMSHRESHADPRPPRRPLGGEGEGTLDRRHGEEARGRSGRAAGTDLRTAILDEARRVIVERGLHALSTRGVAKAVGCTATSIYIYFRSKDALLHAVIDEGMQLLHTRLEDARTLGGAARERLEGMARTYVEFGLEQATLYEVMFLLHPRHMERYPAEAYRRARRNVEALAEVIGEVEGAAPDLARATAVWATLHGHVALWNAARVDASIALEEFVEGALRAVHATLGWNK